MGIFRGHLCIYKVDTIYSDYASRRRALVYKYKNP